MIDRNLPSSFQPQRDTTLYGACDYVRLVLKPPVPWDALGWLGLQEFRDGRSYVYFVAGDVGHIKIGRTEAPMERLAAFHLGSPIDLRFLLLIEGGKEAEKKYHKRFADLRVRGEWFDRAPELVSFIERTRQRQIRELTGTQDTPSLLGKVLANRAKMAENRGGR